MQMAAHILRNGAQQSCAVSSRCEALHRQIGQAVQGIKLNRLRQAVH
jgi:hypothetical protein